MFTPNFAPTFSEVSLPIFSDLSPLDYVGVLF